MHATREDRERGKARIKEARQRIRRKRQARRLRRKVARIETRADVPLVVVAGGAR